MIRRNIKKLRLLMLFAPFFVFCPDGISDDNQQFLETLLGLVSIINEHIAPPLKDLPIEPGQNEPILPRVNEWLFLLRQNIDGIERKELLGNIHKLIKDFENKLGKIDDYYRLWVNHDPQGLRAKETIKSAQNSLFALKQAISDLHDRSYRQIHGPTRPLNQ